MGEDFDLFTKIEDIAKDIQEQKNKVIAMEFTKNIGDLLLKNDVKVKITEYTKEIDENNRIEATYESRYGISIDELDFSKHDKVFENKIAEQKNEISMLKSLINNYRDAESKLFDENQELKKRIAELESKETETCENEPKISDSAPSREWYENRHQSDCIEINRLNTTIDVLIHKVEYLRQFAGLE